MDLKTPLKPTPEGPSSTLKTAGQKTGGTGPAAPGPKPTPATTGVAIGSAANEQPALRTRALDANWVPSGAEISRRAPPRSDLPVLNIASARVRPPIDGRKWVAARLQEIEQLTKKIKMPVTVVFDLDNTVFDTRGRTLHAARAFDAANGTSYFAGRDLADIAVDGRSTATKLRLPGAVVEAFAAFWEQSFWTPANLAHDVPMQEMVDLVKRSQAAGATVKFLTGRWESFHDDTMLGLKKAGLDVDPKDLVCKPKDGPSTPAFKEIHLKAWSASSELGFFVTEGVADLKHVKGFLPDLPLLRLDCTFEDASGLAALPVWPRIF